MVIYYRNDSSDHLKFEFLMGILFGVLIVSLRLLNMLQAIPVLAAIAIPVILSAIRIYNYRSGNVPKDTLKIEGDRIIIERKGIRETYDLTKIDLFGSKAAGKYDNTVFFKIGESEQRFMTYDNGRLIEDIKSALDSNGRKSVEVKQEISWLVTRIRYCYKVS